jgi:hypothetical protein
LLPSFHLSLSISLFYPLTQLVSHHFGVILVSHQFVVIFSEFQIEQYILQNTA